MSNTNTRYACEHVLDDLADFDKICEHVNGNGRKRPIRPCQTQTHGMHVSMS